jgi:hypothetical protein
MTIEDNLGFPHEYLKGQKRQTATETVSEERFDLQKYSRKDLSDTHRKMRMATLRI